MHAVLITFQCDASPADLAAPFDAYAEELRKQPGLVSKAWIVTPTGYGGFHVFVDPDAAGRYLESDLAAGLMATEGFDNFEVTRYDMLDELSAKTGVSETAVGASLAS